MVKNAYIVIPVHNQCRRTLLCLDNLADQGLMEWTSIVVVDDGSTDGTAENIRNHYPEVHLLYGDGNLWWTGGIVKGMQYAMNSGAEFIVWLNDDCRPKKGALELLVEYSSKYDCISVGQSITPSGYVYSGKKKTFYGLKELFCHEQETMICDFFSGNCVCIPTDVVLKIGLPDKDSFPHFGGDHDYGLRATKAEIKSYVIGSAICENDDNLLPHKRSWLLDDISLKDVWTKEFMAPYGQCHFKTFFLYKWRHWGVCGLLTYPLPYLKFLAICILRIFIPKIFLLKIYGSHSNAHKIHNFYKKRKDSEN